MSTRYNFRENEIKWQQAWAEASVYKAEENLPKYYVLEMFPYPSGRLHMGHVRNYIIGDVIARYKKCCGYSVLHPMGWDAFGLPAENAAIQHKVHPQTWTLENVRLMKEEFESLGISYDWNREILSCSPDYYVHEQKMFLDFLKKGIAYRKESFGGYDQWGATGFLDGGTLPRVVNETTGVVDSIDLVGETSRDTKLTYITPRKYGFQVGASYTPRTEHRGEQTIESGRSVLPSKKPFTTDNIASGINFIHKFTNGIETGLSATSIFAQTHPEFRGAPPRRNTASFALGGTISYLNFGFSAEYGNNGKSQQLKRVGNQSVGNKVNAGQFVDFGVSYKWGATKLSAGYYYGWRKALGGGETSNFVSRKAKTNAVAAAIDHKLAPGLGIYAEYENFQMKNPAALVEGNRINTLLKKCSDFKGPVRSNKTNVFVVGSRVVF